VHVISSPKSLQRTCLEWRCRGLETALVPTMGSFHEGHLSLMRWARANAQKVIVSLFVNPIQFAPTEDLSSYPSDRGRDEALARGEGVDILFCPTPEAMYGQGASTLVAVPALSRTLCGKSRPNHFQGVATVVAKLFNLCLPNVAVFGEKDWQQLKVVARMVSDLNMPVRIQPMPIVRESDGLAMSSRNAYLSTEERAQAPAIHAGLRLVREMARSGETSCARLIEAFGRSLVGGAPLARIDYAEIVDPQSLETLETLSGPALMAVAVHLGRARLIDNILLGEDS
jgi:pantoate--beta-alanine ligase